VPSGERVLQAATSEIRLRVDWEELTHLDRFWGKDLREPQGALQIPPLRISCRGPWL
jgi:hypothetical protein